MSLFLEFDDALDGGVGISWRREGIQEDSAWCITGVMIPPTSCVITFAYETHYKSGHCQ